jgi:stage V sporulation protein SpoVS
MTRCGVCSYIYIYIYINQEAKAYNVLDGRTETSGLEISAITSFKEVTVDSV